MTMSSRPFYSKSQTFMCQKLSLVAEYFDAMRGNGNLLEVRDAFRKRFAAVVSGQYWALFRAESMRPSFSGAITVYFLMVTVVAIVWHAPDHIEMGIVSCPLQGIDCG